MLVAEVEHRLDEMERGEVAEIPAEEVLCRAQTASQVIASSELSRLQSAMLKK